MLLADSFKFMHPDPPLLNHYEGRVMEINGDKAYCELLSIYPKDDGLYEYEIDLSDTSGFDKPLCKVGHIFDLLIYEENDRLIFRNKRYTKEMIERANAKAEYFSRAFSTAA